MSTSLTSSVTPNHVLTSFKDTVHLFWMSVLTMMRVYQLPVMLMVLSLYGNEMKRLTLEIIFDNLFLQQIIKQIVKNNINHTFKFSNSYLYLLQFQSTCMYAFDIFCIMILLCWVVFLERHNCAELYIFIIYNLL